jgi:hypothetical protein
MNFQASGMEAFERELAQGDSILLRDEASDPLVMSGRVADPEGQPVADALIEVLKGGINTVEYTFWLARELCPGSARPPSFVAANNRTSPSDL